MITIYHNPRCSKSRECLAFIENSDHELEIINYIQNPLKYRELQRIIKKLKFKPIDLVRQNEPTWKEHFDGKTLTEKEVIQAMVKFPILIQRPIAVKGEKALIARPLEKIMKII